MPGSRIQVAGDATFVSLNFYQDADFNRSGLVDDADYSVWRTGYNSSTATQATGDANGDGVVNAADYTLWKDSVGLSSIPGGITLADSPGDQLFIGGRATFRAVDGASSFDVSVGEGAGAWTTFGSVVAQGDRVVLQEDTSTTLVEVRANSLSLQTAGVIEDAPGAQIEIEGPASFVSRPETLRGDFDRDGTVTQLDYNAWVDQYGVTTTIADYTAWRDDLGRSGGAGGIRLADSVADRLTVAGLAEFVVERRGVVAETGVRVGDNSNAVVRLGSVGFFAPELVQITEADGMDLAGPSALRPSGSIVEGRLELTSLGPMTDAPNAVVETRASLVTTTQGDARFRTAATIQLADAAAASNSLKVQGHARFESIGFGPATTIDVGVDPASTTGQAAVAVAHFGSLSFASAGRVRIAEDDSMHLHGALATEPLLVSSAGELVLRSAASIADAPRAAVTVTTSALVQAATTIQLADAGSAENAFTVGGHARFQSTGSGALGNIDIGVEVEPATTTGQPALAVTRFGSLSFASAGRVRIAEDTTDASDPSADPRPGLHLHGSLATEPLLVSTAGELVLRSADSITDNSRASVTVTGDALLEAATTIQLADGSSTVNSLKVGRHARYESNGAGALGNIDVGIASSSATGQAAGAVARFGSLSFDTAGRVRIAEDTTDASDPSADANSGLNLHGQLATEPLLVSTAGELVLRSAASITDDPRASVTVVGDALLQAATTIQLADAPSAVNEFKVGGHARFQSTGSGALGNIDVGVEVEPAITTGQPALAVTRFGSLSFASAGRVRIAEDDNVDLHGSLATEPLLVSSAGELVLRSAASISDNARASVTVTGNALAQAATTIQLADAASAENSLTVGGHARFESRGAGPLGTIDVGVEPTSTTGQPALAVARFGSLSFDSAGQVRIAEDDSMHLHGSLATEPLLVSSAGELVLRSAASITDATRASIVVSGDALFDARTTIVLAEANVVPTSNLLEVIGHARFASAGAASDGLGNIDVGVIGGPSPGGSASAAARVLLGSTSFSTAGMVRISNDRAVVLSGVSEASSLELESVASITDSPDAETYIGKSAELRAGANSDVVLGVGAARFSMAPASGGDAAPFDASRYVALAARNVSLDVDSSLNLRTATSAAGTADAARYNQIRGAFAGTFFVTATGNVTQVGAAGATLTPLEAARVAVASGSGAVMLGKLRLTAADALPNLALTAGNVLGVDASPITAGLVASGVEVSEVPTDRETRFSPPIVLNRSAGTPIGDGSGSERLAGARISERGDGEGAGAAIADAYSVVAQALGNVVIGAVQNAATLEQTLVGISVEGTGHVFVRTSADGTEAGNLTFTSVGAPLVVGRPDSATIVQLAGGVLTAAAAGALVIDTQRPDDAGESLQTTRLRSATGTVTSVDALGPRVRLDLPSKSLDAATTEIVRATNPFSRAEPFEQRVTIAVGSRGEDNLLVEAEWADVANIRPGSPAREVQATDFRTRRTKDFSDAVVGSSATAELVLIGLEGHPNGTVESPSRDTSFPTVQSQATQPLTLADPSLSFRVVTLRHNYAKEFIPQNPSAERNRLPTTIRVYHDPSISLFQSVTANSQQSLNNAVVTLSPQVLNVRPPGEVVATPPTRRSEARTAPQYAAPLVARSAPLRTDLDSVVVTSTVEKVVFGRVDDDGLWLKEPGVEWPKPWDGTADGEFIDKIRALVDSSPASEGKYRIVVETPRGERQVAEWVKGDSEPLDEEQAQAPATGPRQDSDATAEAASEAPAQGAPLDGAPVEPPSPLRIAPSEGEPIPAPEVQPLGSREVDGNGPLSSWAVPAAIGIATATIPGERLRSVSEAGGHRVSFLRLDRKLRRLQADKSLPRPSGADHGHGPR
ncbi:MAG: hypothetical protein ACRCT8_12830 [Lacipirellulaceae bacterium]